MQQISNWSEAMIASLTGAASMFFTAVPRLIGFAIILIVIWIVASIIEKALVAVLRAVRFNVLAERSGLAGFIQKSNMIRRGVSWYILAGDGGLRQSGACRQVSGSGRRPVWRRSRFRINRAHDGVRCRANLRLPSESAPVAGLYKNRWQVEIFFKWIKQHLRIKKFLGNSRNAVKTQIWCAISTYVLIAIVKKELKLEASLYTLLQILSVSVFEKTQLSQALRVEKTAPESTDSDNQLNFFDF